MELAKVKKQRKSIRRQDAFSLDFDTASGREKRFQRISSQGDPGPRGYKKYLDLL